MTELGVNLFVSKRNFSISEQKYFVLVHCFFDHKIPLRSGYIRLRSFSKT